MLKQFRTRLISVLLVAVMAAALFPLVSIPASISVSAASVTSGSGNWINGKLTYFYSVATSTTNTRNATGSVSANGNTLTVKATSAEQYNTGGCNSTTVAAADTTTSVTVTNASSFPLKFNSLTTSGSALVAGVSQDDTIAPGATFTITVTSPANGENATEKTGTVTIEVVEQTNVTITLAPSPYVSYTVNGATVAQNGSEQTFTADAGASVSLPSITAPAGYEFKGWRIGSDLKTNISSFTADTAYTVFPVIVSEGTDITTSNFKVGSTTYTFWEDAIYAAATGDGKVFVNAEEVTLPTNVLDNLLPTEGGDYVKPVSGGGVEYIIPAGVTLVVPYETSSTVHTTTPAYGYKARVTPSPFRTLTVPNGANITVNGSISVDSYVCAYGQVDSNGTPSGPHGKIVMKSGSEMTFNSGANLYCYGYINGDGNLYVKSGAKVYELFQFCDWRGGNGTKDIVGNSQRVFPMSQYYVQNVEAPMTLYKGATEYVWSAVNMSSSSYPTSQIEFIGTNGMFKLTGSNSDYIIKRYHANVDRLEITAHGDMSLNNLTVKVSGLPLIGTLTMDSKDYVLPLNNMEIVIESGTSSIASSQTYGVAFLPSSKLTVNEGATFSVNAPVYFYDAEDWGGYCGASNKKLVSAGYDTANGANNSKIRTADNLQDAELDVNGTVTVSNKLYTTEHGANITSSQGTGIITFTSAPATASATTYQATQSGNAISAYVPITVNNAWLHNGDDTYSETVSTGVSTWEYDKSGEHWYRYLVDFKYNNTLIDRGYYCENNDTVTYDASWLTNLGATASNGTATISGSNVNVTGVTADSTVTLTGTPKEYIPTFVLNEHQYESYQRYTDNTISNTTTIDGETYYIVDQASSALAVGTAYAQPSDESVGVTAENHNTITWNMSGLSATSGDPYRGVVPAGETAGGPVYIYGFYTGAVAYNDYTEQYYSTLIGAFEVLPQDSTATITLLADCGTFEDESSTQAYTSYEDNQITLDLNGHHAVGRIMNMGIFTLELNGGTFDYVTGGVTDAGKAAVLNEGTMTIQDSVGGGKITADGVGSSSFINYNDVIRNNEGGVLTVGDGITLEHKQSTNNYSLVLLNYGSAVLDNVTLTAERGVGVGNSGASSDLKIKNSNLSFNTSAYYGVYNTASGTISEIDNCDLSTQNVNVIYNVDGSKINIIKNSSLTITTPTTKNTYAVFNYGGKIDLIDNCDITANSGINNRNKRGSNAITAGYNIAYYGTIGTIKDTTVEVGQYAVYNGGKINTMIGSSFTAHPASAQVPWPSGTAALNGNSVHCYTVCNSNTWWYDSAIWKRTDTSVNNNGTTMLQHRVNEYKTGDEYMPTIGTITDCTIEALNTSTSSSYGYYALQNLGVINTINGDTEITSKKHPNNASSVNANYAFRNESGGKIGSIGSDVTISATNYAISNLGARYSQTDTTYSTSYLESGALKSGGLATDYDYTYADVSEIVSSGATVSATSQYAYLNYSKIGSITGSVSANYNVIVNAVASGTTTAIEGTTANTRAIEHRYFENNDSSVTTNEYRRYFEYERNTEDGCYIGSIDATVTATGAGYQAISNQGYIGTLAGTVTTPTGKATSSSTYYPLIYNGDQRQATLKQTEDYYIETNGAGATKYEREYTYAEGGPTIDEISCTATNPEDYTLRNLGTINTLSGTISGKTITVANEAAGHYQTRKTRMFHSSASRLAASKASSEVDLEYTKQPAKITHIDGATISTTGTKTALRNYGYIESITGSTITSTSTDTIVNNSSTIIEYTSNRADVLIGCVPNGTSSCALRYDMEQTIDEDETRVIGTIDTIGAGNYIQGTGNGIANKGYIGTIDSGDGKTTIIYTSGSATNIYNYEGNYTRRTNTDAVLTKDTGTLTNNYTYEYVPAYIGTIKNVYIQGKRNAILNGTTTANENYDPVTIGEIGEGAEIRTTATSTYSAVQNNAANAQIEKITGGIFMTGSHSSNLIYAVNNASTTYPIEITGGDFRGAKASRDLALFEPDNTDKYTYPGAPLSTNTETATYHTLSNKELTAKTTGFYYIAASYPVTFDMQGHGTAPESQTIVSGQKATQPNDPALNSIVTDSGAKYRFDGWYTDDTFETAFDFNSAINKDTTVYAKWTPIYTITWKLDENTVIDSTEVAQDVMPTHADPTKAADAQYTYTFTGWDPAITAVTGDATYTAQFTQTTNKYDITWVDGDGNTLKTEQVAYGETPSYTGETPTKTADAQYTYTFTGWDPAITAVTGDATYTAQFTQTTNKYDITWVDGDGNTLKTEQVAYGETPSYTGDTPTKTADDQYTYTFNNNWSPAIVPVTGDATYTALFSTATNEYTITWLDEDGNLIDTTSVAYGDTPTHTAPEKACDDVYTYDFAGWTPAIVPVTGNATYQAKFNKEMIFYGHSLTLEGDIGTNFLINLNSQIDPQTDLVEVEFSWNNKTKTVDLSTIEPAPVRNSQNQPVRDSSGEIINFYKTTVNVAPKEMNDPITAHLKVNGEVISTEENYCAADYPINVIKNSSSENSLTRLCRAMLNYAAKAQVQFNYLDRPIPEEYTYTPDPIDVSLLVDYHTGENNFTKYGLKSYYGSTLQLNSLTTYSLFFRVSDQSVANGLLKNTQTGKDYVTATIGDKSMQTAVYFVSDTNGVQNAYLRVDILNISAADITRDIVVTFNNPDAYANSITFTVNSGAYINSALNNGNSITQSTVTAMYDYNQKAKIYFQRP